MNAATAREAAPMKCQHSDCAGTAVTVTGWRSPGMTGLAFWYECAEHAGKSRRTLGASARYHRELDRVDDVMAHSPNPSGGMRLAVIGA